MGRFLYAMNVSLDLLDERGFDSGVTVRHYAVRDEAGAR